MLSPALPSITPRTPERTISFFESGVLQLGFATPLELPCVVQNRRVVAPENLDPKDRHSGDYQKQFLNHLLLQMLQVLVQGDKTCCKFG